MSWTKSDLQFDFSFGFKLPHLLEPVTRDRNINYGILILLRSNYLLETHLCSTASLVKKRLRVRELGLEGSEGNLEVLQEN